MDRLRTDKRVQVVSALVEGVSINATCRMTGVAKHTVLNLLRDLGCAAAEYHHRDVRGLKVRRLQCDEIWAFCGAKAKNVTPEKEAEGWGDVWTWTAIDADTKLCVTYYVGDRGGAAAYEFMQDCSERIIGRPQITTDGHKPYLQAIEDAFGADVDYAQLHKIYGAPTDADQRRYSPATCIGYDMKTVSGDPDPKHVSTSFVERHNLTIRMGMRRFTRLTNGFSKKFENHAAMVAIHSVYYNFARIHKTLRITPAMAAELSDSIWSLDDIVTMADNYLPKPEKRGPYKKR